MREDLNRFPFSPNDIVVPIVQDGLVANLAKYLDSQSVIGVTPDPTSTEGVLTRHNVGVLPALLEGAAQSDVNIQTCYGRGSRRRGHAFACDERVVYRAPIAPIRMPCRAAGWRGSVSILLRRYLC
ncbi:hypothetical protein V8J82_21940 [Gymnodinialimonas sp. 2305UL16-5]|uniref:hypothetical protein n=1 Tax=Gymnodinialimonas mytili TaxID=3126503 RepID=UPI0030B760ED